MQGMAVVVGIFAVNRTKDNSNPYVILCGWLEGFFAAATIFDIAAKTFPVALPALAIVAVAEFLLRRRNVAAGKGL